MTRLLDKLLLIVSCALTLTIIFMGTAPAADAPVYKNQAIVAAPAANYWNGFYLSGGFGYGWGDSDPIVDEHSVTTTPPKYKWQKAKIITGTESGSYSQRDSGALIGGGLGVDWRIMPAVVIGAEVEWNKAWIKGSTLYSDSQITREIKSLGLVTGRVGVLVDALFSNNPSPRHLVYFKGGGAWRTESINVTGQLNGETSNTEWGWAWGGGLESALSPSWRLRLEGMHARFPDQNTSVTGTGSSGSSSTSVYSGNVRTQDHLTWVAVRAIWRPFQ